MSTCPKKTIDSNSTGLRFAMEHCLKQLLPNSPAVEAEDGVGAFVEFEVVDMALEDEELVVDGITLTFKTIIVNTQTQLQLTTVSTAVQATNLRNTLNTCFNTNPAFSNRFSAGGSGVTIRIMAATPGTAENGVVVTTDSQAIDGTSFELDGGVDPVPALPGLGPVWKPLEPNSYSDFGPQVTTVARNPINQSRQRKKGVVTDVDASAGFVHDLTQDPALMELMQGFLFAHAREHGTTASLRTGQANVTGAEAAGDTYTFHNTTFTAVEVNSVGADYKVGDKLVATNEVFSYPLMVRVNAVDSNGGIEELGILHGGIYDGVPGNDLDLYGGSGSGATVDVGGAATAPLASFIAGELVLASGFGIVANNGVKLVDTDGDGVLGVTTGLTDETPPAGAALQSVGYQFATGEVAIVKNGDLVRLVSTGTPLENLGCLPGSWLYIGDDDDTHSFNGNRGFARISSLIDLGGGDTAFELDKVSWTDSVAESGTGKTIRVYWGTVIRNEPNGDDIVQLPVQFERTLGNDADGVQTQYSVGSVPNEFTLNVAQASIVTMDLAYVACDGEYRTGAEGPKPGMRPGLLPVDAYNTTDDFSRIKLSAIDPASSNPISLFEFCTDLTLTINNNGSAVKAIGHLGAIGMTAGTFEVGGELTTYFTTVAGPMAVRNNLDMTVDYILVKQNVGVLFDIPLVSLGGGLPAVEQDQPITLPLETNAAESKFGHTLLIQSFPYLPDVAG